MSQPERDILAAASERIIVFDGGMGATLERYELSSEDYGGLAGQVPRGAGPASPRRHLRRPRGDARRRRRGGRDRFLPGLEAEARRVGPRRSHGRDQPQGRRDRAPGRGPRPLRRRLDRPDRVPARQRRPDPRRDHLRGPGRGLRRTGRRPGRRWGRPDHHRDGTGHPRGAGGDRRRPRGLQAGRSRGPDPGLRVAASERRQDAARHRHRGRPRDPRGHEGGHRRAQLLDRARGHAGRDPLPRRELAAARALHPERRPADPGARRRDDLPGGP